MVAVLVGVQGSVDSPINSQIGPFSTILQLYMCIQDVLLQRLRGRNAWGF